MIGKNQPDKRSVSSAEAMEILEKRKEDGELGYEQKLAYEHIKKFSTHSAEEIRKMVKELEQYGIGENTAIKIADVMPIDIVQLKHILEKEKKTFEEDEVNKMWEIVQGRRGK
jgi:DNA-directed RNA polymerase subunit F